MPSTGSFCAMADDVAACAGIVFRADPERFRAVMAAPVAAREKLFPIYAFNIEVARAPWVTVEPLIAEMRLQWWRDTLAAIGAGEAARHHEVAAPLARAIGPQEAALLDALIEARRWDIHREPFADLDAFRAHIDATSGNLLLAAARVLDPAAPEGPLRAAGLALGLANWLRAVPALEAAGRVPLVDGRPEAVRALAAEGLDALARARAARRQVSRMARPALLAVWPAGPVLAAARAAPGRVARGRLEPAPAISRLRLIARAATGRW